MWRKKTNSSINFTLIPKISINFIQASLRNGQSRFTLEEQDGNTSPSISFFSHFGEPYGAVASM